MVAVVAKRTCKKIGRNDPCPCGSGRKYKKCHGGGAEVPENSVAQVRRVIEELQAATSQREKQQGLGRPIISASFEGYHFVAVGPGLYYSREWQTFHDFLLDYIKDILGPEWGTVELKKELENRHPILQWYQLVCEYRKANLVTPGQVHTAPMTGVVAAYLGLAYNLYLLAHNAKIQRALVNRLKNKDQFRGAYYETFVAAAFIKAGFTLEFEDESDGARSHCEFTATCQKTGAKFSVEAKARTPGKAHVDVGNQLYAALAKEALHTRIVFIDLNVPDDVTESTPVLLEALTGLRSREGSLTVHDDPAPAAYVIVTNHPYQFSLETLHFRCSALAEGFKIPDFKVDAEPVTIREAIMARNKHKEVLQLMDSIREHYEIPSTFDGDIPQLAFGQTSPRLRIGQKYMVPGDEGDVTGELVDAVVMEPEKRAFGIYRLESGQTIIAACPLTDDELAAYKRYPETFFGVYKRQTRKTEDPLELFDFFYETYRRAPRATLLRFLEGQPDYESLKDRTQEELAVTYCERMVWAVCGSVVPNATAGEDGTC